MNVRIVKISIRNERKVSFILFIIYVNIVDNGRNLHIRIRQCIWALDPLQLIHQLVRNLL